MHSDKTGRSTWSVLMVLMGHPEEDNSPGIFGIRTSLPVSVPVGLNITLSPILRLQGCCTLSLLHLDLLDWTSVCDTALQWEQKGPD